MTPTHRRTRGDPLSRGLRLLLALALLLSGLLLPARPAQAAPPEKEKSTRIDTGATDSPGANLRKSVPSAPSAPSAFPIHPAQAAPPEKEKSTRIDTGATDSPGANLRKSVPSVDSAFSARMEQTPVNQACPLFGDADCDCKVTASDIQAYAGHWAENNSSPAYHINFDADNDGDVDVADIQQAAARLGDVCAPSGLTATVTGAVVSAANGAPVANAKIIAAGTAYSTTTTGAGKFSLALPPGDYQLEISAANFTGDERQVAAQANQLTPVADVRLYPLDSKTAAIGVSGGTITNSLSSSSLSFPAGALANTQSVRVTYLPNNGLPGGFPDGSVPMGFSAFEPEGVVFPQGKEVLWTVAYTGTLPVGTDTLCYWWDGKEGRWRDPVPGKVVQLPGGGKALQARVPHFSAYGHALPGIAGQRPGQGGDPIVGEANKGKGPDQ